MDIFDFEYEDAERGRVVLESMTAEEALAAGAPAEVVAEVVTAAAHKAAVEALRGQIAKEAGDLASLVGTLGDAVGLLLVSVAEFSDAVSRSSKIADIAAAGQGLADELAPVRAEEGVEFTHQLKGTAAVLAEVMQRATAVSHVLRTAAPG